MQVAGIPTAIALQNGKVLRNVKPRGTETPIYNNMYLLTQDEAEHLWASPCSYQKEQDVPYTKKQEAGPFRTIVKGKAKVAEAPSEEDWQQAAIYQIQLSPEANGEKALLNIDYRGDCARLYADGQLIADNFYYGRPFLFGLWRLPASVRELELRILPLQQDAPIYLPTEADKRPGEEVKAISIKH